MTNREFDTLILGFAIGGFLCLWLGYRIGARAERWKIERSARHAQSKNVRQHAKNIPFPKPGEDVRFDQSRVKDFDPHQGTRVVIAKARHIPLDKRLKLPVDAPWYTPDAVPAPKAHQFIRIGDDEFVRAGDIKDEANETSRLLRADAVAAITGAGYKRAAADAALDACTLAERAGGLEVWVASALRRLAAKP